MAHILVINSGSSSIKYQLIDMPSEQVLTQGRLEHIGSVESVLIQGNGENPPDDQRLPTIDHTAGLDHILTLLTERGLLDNHTLSAVGHRVVHGGEVFTKPVQVDADFIAQLDSVNQLAPLHNAANLAGIKTVAARWPKLPQVAVFDTAFHHNLPDHARHYALPLKLQQDLGIRRYGFHGLSHQYAAMTAAQHLDRPLSQLKLITLHLGNGASACAIHGGRSLDTSMGFTPLEGLVMGSRCGDLDPALPAYIREQAALSARQLDHLLNQQSGLQGLCGDNDMRRIEQRMAAGDRVAQLAFDMFCYRIRKYIGAYVAVLNGIDALIFTGGIGEHAIAVRAAVCTNLDALGIIRDAERDNRSDKGIRQISAANAPTDILVIPTNEELGIARATDDLLQGKSPG